MMRTATFLSLSLALAPADVPAREKILIQKKAAADPWETLREADGLVAQGDAVGALARMREAIERIRKLPPEAEVRGPGGDLLGAKEALFRYTLRTAEVASLVSWREAAKILESASKLAPDRAGRVEVEVQLEAARAQLAAGHDRAPSFLGDDPTRLTESPATSPLPIEAEPGEATE